MDKVNTIVEYLSKYKCVVFDFDETISQSHLAGIYLNYIKNDLLYEEYKNIEEFVKNIKKVGNTIKLFDYVKPIVSDVENVKRLFDELKAKERIICIASYGYKGIIHHVLELLDISKDIHMIITPSNIPIEGKEWKEGSNPPPGYNKNNMLELIEKSNTLEKKDIILIDDSGDNIRNAISEGYKGICVSREHNNNIIDKLYETSDVTKIIRKKRDFMRSGIKASRKASRKTSKKASRKASKKASRKTSKKASRKASKKASRKTSKKASRK